MAITGFTITHARAKYIDFTKPFMNLGITVLFRKPKPDPPELMSFLAPLDNTVWAGIITVFLGISLVLLLTARFTPYEWINPHPCDPTTEEVENQFSPLSSLWYVIAALMQQGKQFQRFVKSILSKIKISFIAETYHDIGDPCTVIKGLSWFHPLALGEVRFVGLQVVSWPPWQSPRVLWLPAGGSSPSS